MGKYNRGSNNVGLETRRLLAAVIQDTLVTSNG